MAAGQEEGAQSPHQDEPDGAPPTRKGMAAMAADENFSVAAALGGPRGVAESAVPGIAFVVAQTVFRNLTTSVVVALTVAALFAINRLIRREPLTPAISGLIGVGIAAAIARSTGQAADFYVWGFVRAGITALACLISIAVGWPLVGVLLGLITDEGMSWRDNPARRRAYVWATAVWAGVFILRLVVQLPIYFRQRACRVTEADPGACDAGLGFLGTVNLLLGLPVFAVAVYVCWLILRRVPPTPKPVEETKHE